MYLGAYIDVYNYAYIRIYVCVYIRIHACVSMEYLGILSGTTVLYTCGLKGPPHA